jgi:uncharacterized membrane protein HdeD (DUF308 family)
VSTPTWPESTAPTADRRQPAAMEPAVEPGERPDRSRTRWGENAAVGLASGVGRHWGLPVLLGLLTLLAGVGVLAWPRATVLVIAIVVGLQLLLNGVIRIVQSFAADGAGGGERVLLALLGVFSVVVGVLCLRDILQSVVALVVLVGLFWLVSGIIDVVTGLWPGSVPARGWRLVSGTASVLGGIVVLAYPGISVRAFTVILGIWLLLYGVLLIATGLAVRRESRNTKAPQPAF